MPHMLNETDAWVWSPQMDAWFAGEWMAHRATRPVLARLMPDLPRSIEVEETPLHPWNEVLV